MQRSVKAIRARFLIAAAELERRKRELGLRLDQLEEERCAFEEIRNSLVEEERILVKRLALARKERDRIIDRMDSRTQRTMEVLEQVEGLKRRIVEFERRCSENTKREQDLEVQIASAEEDLLAARRQILLVAEELETGRKALARMDRRISSSRMKR